MKKTVVLIIILTSILCLSPSYSFAQYAEYIGKEVELKSFEGVIPVYAGTSKRSFNGLTGNLMGLDRQGYLTKILGHLAFEVENGTTARVIEANFWEKTAKIEITSGGYTGWTGWILINHAIGY